MNDINHDYIRSQIQNLEDEFYNEYNIQISVNGSRRKGFKELKEYIYDNKDPSPKVNKSAYEYWVCLILIISYFENYNLHNTEKQVPYLPCEGHEEGQLSTFCTDDFCWFVNPSLPEYNQEYIYSFLNHKTNIIEPRKHMSVRPSHLITNPILSKLPFTAYSGNSYNIRNVPFRNEITLGHQEYNKFEHFDDVKDNIKFLVECKNSPLKKDDLNRILWYIAAYQKPLILFSQNYITDNHRKKLNDDLNLIKGSILDANFDDIEYLKIIDKFEIGDITKCKNKVKDLFDNGLIL